MQFRNDIQGLRALAVLFVFIFHLSSSYLPGGFVGVDMFFVISGYLISKIIMDRIAKDKFNLKDFYISRIKRIIPAYYFLLIVVWLLFILIFANSEVGIFKMAHFWTFLFNSNNHFAGVDNYFGASSNETPLLHTWTLSVEMQFYFILPLLLLIIRNKKVLVILLSILTTILICYSTYEILHGGRGQMYFSLLARSPEFFIGVLLAALNLESKPFFIRNSTFLGIIGITALLVTSVFFNENSPFPGVLALIPCLATALLLVSPTSKVNGYLSNKVLSYFGEISYSVYLWHWPIMAFYRYHNFRYEFTVLETIAVITVTILCSIISYYCIEKPLRSKNGLKFYIPFALMICINIAMIYFVVPVKNKMANLPPKYGAPNFGLASHSNTFKEVETYGDLNYDGKKILLLGDSHALTFKPYFNAAAKDMHISFRTITNDTYPTIPGLTDAIITDRNLYSRYSNLKPFINNEVKKADIIVLCLFGDGIIIKEPLKNFIESLEDSKKLVILADYPTLDKNPVRINRGYLRSNDHKYKLIYTSLENSILKITSQKSNVKYIDFSKNDKLFKDAPFFNDTLMYYDHTHLNEYGAEKYYQFTGDKFREALNWALK